MSNIDKYPDLICNVKDYIAVVEIDRAPHNFFDLSLITQIANIYNQLEAMEKCRVIILASKGKSFCAGADFNNAGRKNAKKESGTNPIYAEALRLFACSKPSIVVVQGAAIGGGLGLALTADFRIGCPESRFSANFSRLGFHPGFALSYTLPTLIGHQKASELFFTGRRINGTEAFEYGLLDRLVKSDDLMDNAKSLATEIALSSPTAVVSIRKTLRKGLTEKLEAAVIKESQEQFVQMQSDDFKEGVAAMTERRHPSFK
ncbi:enoyl-CoA hydratase/isomerase family protein [Advenella sp. S44]|uniref:enoyl-CoA hydratase/isomerase family protein n=1 Tax=Advenella sp. S44 TaxID=1982755 RepID=UPI000C29D15A|nr:enoyl-CoA hydratase/isomerase family protein [Advenella sp. S44]